MLVAGQELAPILLRSFACNHLVSACSIQRMCESYKYFVCISSFGLSTKEQFQFGFLWLSFCSLFFSIAMEFGIPLSWCGACRSTVYVTKHQSSTGTTHTHKQKSKSIVIAKNENIFPTVFVFVNASCLLNHPQGTGIASTIGASDLGRKRMPERR